MTRLGTQRSHANGWLATVIQNEDGSVEGYLWDEDRQPLERLGGPGVEQVQQGLDRMAVTHGHTCSKECGEWTEEASEQ